MYRPFRLSYADQKVITRLGKIADFILAKSKDYQTWSDDQLKAKTSEFKTKIKAGTTLDELLPDAYAVAHAVVKRVTGLDIFRVQVIGAIILHEGDVAEMKTGEGKTITSVLPAYLNALPGEGVHIVTVNQYLVERDAKSNGKVFSFLGLTVGFNSVNKTQAQKREAFDQDITYTTHSELGFDYLRDNMTHYASNQVLRKKKFLIGDEVDSLMIDEAETPLLISGGEKAKIKQYQAADQFAKSLSAETDVQIDKESRQAFLSSEGVKKAEKFFQLKSLFVDSSTLIYHLVLNALKANFVFRNEVEYMVRDNEILLIDQHTGRIMEGRAYSDGLHQAIQAKEHVTIEPETVTLATITYQNFLRLYEKLSGMTGTAKTEEEEFLKIYNMRVISVPPNKPVIRKDHIDKMFANRHSKLKYLTKKVLAWHKQGQPVLIGTTSVDASEVVARYLRKAGLHFEMLNAKNHKREAEIIACAGLRGAITLATNMAGRGTDIKLGPGTAELGGLVVVGIERNEARRIDNQLRGRSGRQGDPGESHLYVAADDQLMVRFAGNRLMKIFKNLKDGYVQSRMLSRSITSAQKKSEGMKFDQRKNILDYDNVLSQHREAVYSQRNQILRTDDLTAIIKKMHFSCGFYLTKLYGYQLNEEWFVDFKKLIASIEVGGQPEQAGKTQHPLVFKNSLNAETLKNKLRKDSAVMIGNEINDFFAYRVSEVPQHILTQVARNIIISTIDQYWTDHIAAAQKLRTGIYLQSYAQKNPLHSYVAEAAEMYTEMKLKIAYDITKLLAQVVITADDEDLGDRQEQIKVAQRG